jgi:[protein-PII] uridylyltransferase
MLGAEPGVALVAVGGYGRKELLPGSDLDVLLLHDGREGIAKIADRIWYPVWDSGARLDHAVRTVPQARRVAKDDLKVALGLLHARHVAGDPDLTNRLREGALEDWRGNARTRLAELKEMHEERTLLHGELAFLLEPDLKSSRGGQRDVHAIQAIAAAWVAPAPGPRVRAAYEQILDARHVLHDVTGRRIDRLVLEEQDEVARVLGLLDGDALLRNLAGAGRTVAYAVDHAFRQADRVRGRGPLGVRMRRAKPERRPLADGVVEQDGEVVLARAASPASDPVLVLRAAAGAGQARRVPAAAGPVAGRGAGRAARPARGRPERDRRLGGPGPGRAADRAHPGLGAGAEPAATQPAAPVHRGPAPGRVRGELRVADPRRGPSRPVVARGADARHRQGLAG